MATKNSQPARTEPIDIADTEETAPASALLAAWQGIYWLFGGRVDSWEVTPAGVIAHGFSVEGSYLPEKIIEDISHKARRVDFVSGYNAVLGNEPPKFNDSQEMTTYMVQNFKGSVEDGTSRTPAYVRNAASDYKAANGLKKRRGPSRKILRLDALDETTLQGISPELLDQLKTLVNQAAS